VTIWLPDIDPRRGLAWSVEYWISILAFALALALYTTRTVCQGFALGIRLNHGFYDLNV